jgi:glycosyltransferase involved in cell wall biosynthesis
VTGFARLTKTVLCVIGSLNVGGAERHLAQVLPRLDRRRWNPIVYCLSERGILAEELETSGIPVFTSPLSHLAGSRFRSLRLASIAASTLKLSQLMHRFAPTIAHFFLPAAYILGGPASLLTRVPIRIMSRRSLNNYQQGHPFSAQIELALHKRMTAILGNSRRVIEQLRIEEKVPPEKLGLIYNGIDLRAYRNNGRRGSVRASLNIDPNALVFIIIANLIPYKGHRDLLTAFGMVSKELPRNWRLLIVGRDDGIEAELRQLTFSLGLSHNVLFLGPRRDVHDLLESADVSLLSSHQEGFSNSVLEGMAAGLPSIVTDVGGNAEAVIDGKCGLVVPSKAPESFAAAIKRIADNSELRATWGRNARLRVEQNFGIDTCVARYEALYDALVVGQKPIEVAGVGIA